jgi:hypothetical protein
MEVVYQSDDGDKHQADLRLGGLCLHFPLPIVIALRFPGSTLIKKYAKLERGGKGGEKYVLADNTHAVGERKIGRLFTCIFIELIINRVYAIRLRKQTAVAIRHKLYLFLTSHLPSISL